MRFLRRRRRPHEASWHEEYGRALDAELKAVVRERLPREDIVAAISVMVQPHGDHAAKQLIDVIGRGYRWGEAAEAFVISAPDAWRDKLHDAAARYVALRGHPFGDLARGTLVAELLRDATKARLQHVTNGETVPHGSADAAYDWLEPHLPMWPDGEGEDIRRGAFHMGALLWPVETQLLLSVRWIDRMERARQRGALV